MPKAKKVEPASNNESLMALDNVQLIAKLVEERVVSVEVRAPDAETIQLVRDGDGVVEEANALTIANDQDYKLADLRWVSLKNDSEKLEGIRVKANAPPLKLKSAVDALLKPGVTNRLTAVAVIQGKMRAYDNAKRAEGAQTQTEQARLSEQHRQQLAQDAGRLRERAGKTKGGRRVQLIREAEELERTATLMPAEFAAPASADPETAVSGKAKLWKGRVTNRKAFLQWMVQSDERLGYVDFKQGLLNNLAKQIGPLGTAIPGFEYEDENSYRRGKK